MAERRALLIDPDPEFHELLARVLAPYAIQVHAVTDGSDGLGYVPDLEPELIFISVELPDKVGYSICNKAKKGVAKKIPVVLATSTVPPSDLAQHRKLKVHADEYIDKRTATAEELLQKIDALINLGPPLEDAGTYESVDAEDIHFDDDPVSAIAARPSEVTASPPELAETTNVSRDVDPGIDAETEAVFAGLVDDDQPEEGAVEEAPINESSRFDRQETGVRTPTPMEANVSPDSTAQEGLDLGLDAVAEQSSPHAPAAGVTEAEAARTSELEAEVERLRADLDAARRAAPATPTQFSREREFLNLREVINRKEKELLDLREEVDSKDRVILGGKDKIRELDRRLRDEAEKMLGLEGQLVNANEAIAALKNDKDKSLERERGLKARIDLSQAQVRKADEEFEGLKKRSAAEIQALGADLAARKKELDGERRSAAERLARLENERQAALRKAAEDAAAQLMAREKALSDERDTQLAALRADLGDKLERQRQESAAAIAALKSESAKQIAALTSDKEQALARAEKERREALAQAAREKDEALLAAEELRTRELDEAEQRRLSEVRAAEDRRLRELEERDDQALRAMDEAEARRKAEVAALDGKMRAALAAAEERRTTELAALERQRSDQLAAAEERRAGDLAALEERRGKELLAADAKRREDLAAAEARRKQEVEALEDRHTRELGALKRAHDEETAVAAAARQAVESELRAEIGKLDSALGGTRERLKQVEGELARAQATLRQREERIGLLEREIADRDSRIAMHKQEIDRLEKENGELQEQLLKAYQKIKSDEAIANKAKKAMAIALTLLDGEPPKSLGPSPATVSTPANGEADTR